MHYKLQMMNTDFGVGMFAAMPDVNLSFTEKIAHLRKYPYDDYMHEFVLQNFKEFRTRKLKKLIKGVMKDKGKSDPVLTAIMYEACICHDRQKQLLDLFEGLDPLSFVDYTPAIHIRSHHLPDQKKHNKWISLFGDNIFSMKPLPRPDEAGLEPLFTEEELDIPTPTTVAESKAALASRLPSAKPRRPYKETTAHALQMLGKAGAFLGPPKEHKASLSPIARLRHWSVKVRCTSGAMSNSLEGIQTGYGRGLSKECADASYCMELAERFSSYASFNRNGVLGYKNKYPFTVASYDDLEAAALDLDKIKLEVPYAGQKLHWFEGHTPGGNGEQNPVLIPAQLVFLFCNLDEQSLFSALGSTGLASGNTMAEAKVSALTEVIERDCDATMLFDLTRCFRIETDDPEIAPLIQAYKDDGIDVWFMDMTSEFGIPCYKSIVLGTRGDMNKGSGCDLNGKSALISAMTETAYPYPGPQSGPAPQGLPIKKLEELPDYSTGSAEGDLMVLEKTLLDNGYQPAYADLTRKDLDIPVTRAIVPGLEIVSDFDHYSRVSPRLFNNYLKMFE